MKLPTILLFLMLGVAGVYAQPVITTQPVTQSVNVGGTATFSVVATDPNAISYQWQFNGTAIALATSATLTLSNVSAAQAGNYTVYVYDATSGVTSAAAALNVGSGPVISSNLAVSAYSQTFPFYYQIAATNLPTAFGAANLPSGLSVNTQTGVISGTPTTNGMFQITLTATNSTGVGTATLNLTITDPPDYFSAFNVASATASSRFNGIVSGGPNILVLPVS